MAILLAGDSFAELGGYRNHYTTSGYLEQDTSKPNETVDVKHWVELLGEELGYDIVTHGIPGAGVSASSFVALQQLHTNNYDGMVFCVSHHARTLMHKHIDGNWDKWKKLAFDDIVFHQGVDVYNNNKVFSKTFPFHEFEPGEVGVTNEANAEDLLDVISVSNWRPGADAESTPPVTYDERRLGPDGMTYLTQKVGFTYIHDAVTSVVTLDAYCKSHNIPVVFASGFPGGTSETVQALGIDYKHFPFHKAEELHDFVARGSYPSHYSTQEHQHIYNLFKKYYPEYKHMFSKND